MEIEKEMLYHCISLCDCIDDKVRLSGSRALLLGQNWLQLIE